MKIGKLDIKPLFVAPMAGVSDPAFRTLTIRNGFGLAFTEMISANALSRQNNATIKLLERTPEEKIFAPQIFGQNTENIVKAAKILEEEYDAKLIDLNFGCPASKIIKQGSGSALLERPNKIREILNAVVKSSNIPVTCKIRTGISKNKINAIEIATIAQEEGVSAITVHARTQKQGYSGTADWNIIKQVKEKVNIPVIGNGDITGQKDIEAMTVMTKCDGVMIGRAAMNNPAMLIGKNSNNFEEYIKIIEKYNLDIKFANIKIHAMSFSKGLNLGPKRRLEITQAKTIEELQDLLSNS
ncbi:tRNA-dihydrouridine synthase family protein [Candidatus Woesearchaeota archaeon]|nr:tRNA-dihydrouridine synthase family protein [Candidatus Woesearchaeota archaeon]